MSFDISLLGIIIGTIFNMALGMLWYSKFLFGRVWVKETGISMENTGMQKGKMARSYGLTTMAAIITAYVLGFLICNLNIMNVIDAAFIGTMLWIGTSLATVVKNWAFENKSLNLGIINHGYDLVVYVVVSIIFVLLK